MIGTKLTESGNYNITITAVDKAGNIAETSKQATILDVTPPVATIALAGTEDETEGTYKGDVVVTASATDSESGMESLSVSIIKDGSEFYTNTIENTENETIMDTIELTDPGAYTITITAADKAGNITETSKGIEILESTPPEVTIELAESLASKVKVGDYVKYTPKSGETYTSHAGGYHGDVTTINVEGEATATGIQGNGYGKQTFTVPADTSAIKWRVLSIENGKVNLVSEAKIGKNGRWIYDHESLILRGLTGYAYGVEELNAVCSIYGTGEGAEGARSITVEDVNQITGYDVAKDSDYKDVFGQEYELTDGYRWKYTSYNYYYNETGLNTADTNSIAYSLIFGCVRSDQYWIADHEIKIHGGIAEFGLQNVGIDSVWSNVLYWYSATVSDYTYNSFGSVRPVVTLKSTVLAGESTTDENGITTWEIIDTDDVYENEILVTASARDRESGIDTVKVNITKDGNQYYTYESDDYDTTSVFYDRNKINRKRKL